MPEDNNMITQAEFRASVPVGDAPDAFDFERAWMEESVVGKFISEYLVSPFEIRIFSDFDGTLTSEDTLQHLLNNFGDQRWREIEEEVCKGNLSERVALQAEIGTLSIPKEEAIREIQEKISIDPYFARFVRWCNWREISVQILSGGFESLIKPILKMSCPFDLSVEANDCEVDEDGRWKVVPNSGTRLCEMCNHCKTVHLFRAKLSKKQKRLTIYIGDGNTDRCPASFADVVFAKGKLIDYCEEKGISYIAFENFYELLLELKRLIRVCQVTVRRVNRVRRRVKIAFQTASWLRRRILSLPSTDVMSLWSYRMRLRYASWRALSGRLRIERSILKANRALGRDVRQIISKFC